MKRLHVHVSVADLAASILFYEKLFGAAPTIKQDDYAKWMLEDPKVNFAISTGRRPIGVDHLGIQVESDEALRAMEGRLRAADRAMRTEEEQPCCYARSNKYWVTDPTGIAWESFHTSGSIPVYGEDTRGASVRPIEKALRSCCEPQQRVRAESCCAK